MKTITKLFVYSLVAFFCSLNSKAQDSSGMTYQAVIRNSSNALVANSVIGAKVSILKDSPTGAIVYSESHLPTTNSNGLATFIIGLGTAISGDYGTIDWSVGTYYLQTSIDPTGGSNYTITSTSQFLSVPYALLAENSRNAWNTTGNTTNSSDFIGSTNNVDVVFKRNNAKAGIIGYSNTALGTGALEDNTTLGTGNTALGQFAMQNNTAGLSNVGLGRSALRGNTIGNGNTAIGEAASYSNAGFYNTAVGTNSLYYTKGDQNTALGWRALENLTSGGGNIGIGKIVDVPSPTTNNQLSIGNVIYGTNMGNTAAGTIGIGVPVPTEKLEVAGKTKTINLQVTNGAGANKVLTSDATGNATWQNTNKNTGFDVRASNQTIGLGSGNTKVDFELADTDDSYSFNEVSNSFTVPSNGFYHFSVLLAMANPISQNGYLTIRKNSNTLITKVEVLPVTTTNEYISIDADSKLVSGDVITVHFNTNLSSVVLDGYLCKFSGFKVY